MKLYILHSVIVDADGQVSIDCLPPYRSLNAAIKEQSRIVRQYQEDRRLQQSDVQEERCGHFIRVAVGENSEEFQSNIEEFDLDIELDSEFSR